MNVLDLLQEKNITYKEQGNDYLIHCINPEHEDTHPSLHIDKITGVFHCFSCGYKGSIFEEYGQEPNKIKLKAMNLQSKIQRLNSNLGLELPFDALFFRENYRNISAETYDKFDAFTCSSVDELEDRLVFPIKNNRDNVVVFCGRALYTEAKPKYKFYPAHRQPPVFPNNAKPVSGCLFIVEGIFDVLNLYDKGLTNVITAFGVDTLVKNFNDRLAHFRILGTNKFYIMFDGDTAGEKGAERLHNAMRKKGYNVDIFQLPEGVDPGDLTKPEIDRIKESLL